MNIVANSPQNIAPAYEKYYSTLADHFIREIGSGRGIRLVLEVGAGKGQLTVPLLKRLRNSVRLIAADSSRGPYAGWLEELPFVIARNGLEGRVQLLRADARKLVGVENRSVDLIVSNELLCDLTREGHLRAACKEFYRVLKPGGVMVHGEWSAVAEDRSQAVMVKHWPSWSPDQLFAVMKKSGFSDFHVTYFDTTIKFSYRPALEELRGWGASESLLERYDMSLKHYGIRLPSEHIVRCRKPARPERATNL